MADGNPHLAESAYEAIGRRWLGIGNLSSQHWFCGLEPGGTERSDCGAMGGPLRRSRSNRRTHGGGRSGPRALIQPRVERADDLDPADPHGVAFKSEPTDDASCLAYQRDRFAAGAGDEEVLELSAYAAANLGVDSPRERYMPKRIERMRDLLADHQPAFLVCYGTTRRRDFETIVGGPFDSDSFRLSGQTVCAIATYPTPRFRPPPPPSF